MAERPDGGTDALPLESAEELYEEAPVGYLSSLPEGTIVRVNATLLAWTGYERDALVGKRRLYDVLAPGAKIYYETHYAPLLRLQGSVREIAVELVRADGTRLPVLLNSTLVLDDADEPRVVRTTVFDASDRRRYERELLRAREAAEERARAALALEHVNEGVLLVSATGTIDAANPAAEAILGIEEWSGRPVSDVIPEWETLLHRIPVGGARERTPPATLPFRRHGHDLWLEVAGIDSGEGVVYTIRDVTGEQQLEQLRHDLVAIVSHELRTPLTGALGSAQTLQARYADLDDGARTALLDLIVSQGTRLAQIIEQMLLASQLGADNVGFETARFDPGALVARLPEGLGTEEARRRLVLDVVEPPPALGDPGKTTQVLANVVENALKYSDGDVRVRVAAERSAVRFTVTDDGPGIPASERERIFDKFHRLDPSLRRGVGGTGLGLYIARELVRRMDGRIGVLPTQRGTTVFVDLPAA